MRNRDREQKRRFDLLTARLPLAFDCQSPSKASSAGGQAAEGTPRDGIAGAHYYDRLFSDRATSHTSRRSLYAGGVCRENYEY
ncbi:MAG: hypothetical protein IIA33_09845 [Planctomycetes bacterium]|nr:hypothetical protein [Planctomycetota bacterium]